MPQETPNHHDGPTAEAVFSYLELPRFGRELKGMLSRSLRGGVEQGFSVYYSFTKQEFGIYIDRDVSPDTLVSDFHNWALKRGEIAERVLRLHVHPAGDTSSYIPSRYDFTGIKGKSRFPSVEGMLVGSNRDQISIWLWQTPGTTSDLDRIMNYYNQWIDMYLWQDLTWGAVDALEEMLKDGGLHLVRANLSKHRLQTSFLEIVRSEGFKLGAG